MLALIAFSIQAAYAAVHGPNPTHNPFIVVPESSVPHWYEKPGTNHTKVVIWKGHAAHSSDLEASMPNSLFGPLVATSPTGYWPSDIMSAYDVDPFLGAGTIVILDAYGYPNALNDFNTFSAQFGLPVETSTDVTASSNQVFRMIPSGPWTPPPDSGWDVEQALDIEWAHAMAPNATILLVQSLDSSDILLQSVPFASSLVGVKQVSMSWGSQDGSWETQYESSFTWPGVTFFAATGDSAGDISYPAVSQNVVAVGGTTLNVANGQFVSETGWSEEGGGTSGTIGLPSFQTFLGSRGYSNRVVPDVAAVADPATGVAIYSSDAGGWIVVGGTSVATPVTAGLVNAIGNSYNSSNDLLTNLYGDLGTPLIRDITRGSTPTGLRATVGWDDMSGVGAILVDPVTLSLPNPGLLAATANGSVSYSFPAVDPYHGSRQVVTTKTGGPSWVTWDGTTLTATPPANTKAGSYPVGLKAYEPGFGTNTINRDVSIRVGPPALKSAVWSTPSVVSGNSVNLTVNLTNPAPSTGLSVSLSSGSSALTLPASVAFTNGQSSVTISVPTHAVTNPAILMVYASYGGVRVALPLRIIP